MARSYRTTDPDTVYIEVFMRALTRILWSRRLAADVDDIVQVESERLWKNIGEIMGRYSNPVTYAGARATHAAIQWYRTESAHRGSGSHYSTNDDGSISSGRAVVSGNTTLGSEGSELFELIESGALPVDDIVADTLDGAAVIGLCLSGLSDRDRTLVYLVDGCGFTVSEVAAMCDVARETMSRRLSTARNQVRANAADMMEHREVSVA
jgi:RNA polymerase sigma factor (sigma-70 family)